MDSKKYGDANRAWVKLSRKFDATTGDYKTRLWNKFTNCKLEYIKRYSLDWTNYIKLIRGDLQKMNVHKDDMEMTTHILPNFPEA